MNPGIATPPKRLSYLSISLMAITLPLAGCLGGGGGSDDARLLERAAGHDLSDQLFDRPSLLDKLTRQVIQQLGVRRPVARQTEIVDRSDQSFSEQFLPDAIYHNARSERTVDHPFCQFPSTTLTR